VAALALEAQHGIDHVFQHARPGDAAILGGLRRREPRDRHAEGRAGDVVEADLLAEGDGGRVAAMLAADAELEVRARLAPALAAIRISSPTPS
jgi:hypothetical protein